MTAGAGPLADILRRAHALLLDFDGPVCDMFAARPATGIADELRALVVAHGDAVPAGADTAGPLHLLRLVADTGAPSTVQAVADALREVELAAADTAQPTPGIDDVLRTAQAGGRHVAIVSNNSDAAVRRYLDRHGLGQYIDHISARTDGMDQRLMKPSDHLIRRALAAIVVPAEAAALVGDSTSDVQAGATAGVAVIGHANKPGKRERLIAAGATAVIDAMDELADALRAVPLVYP